MPFPSPGDLPDPGIQPASLAALALATRFFTTEPPGKPYRTPEDNTNMETSHIASGSYQVLLSLHFIV